MATRRGARGKERSAGSSSLSNARGGGSTYFERSKQPLEILALIAPLIVLYEIGLIFFLRGSRGTLTNGAHESLLRFFSNFGVDPARLNLPTLALPAVALVVVMARSAQRRWHHPQCGGRTKG